MKGFDQMDLTIGQFADSYPPTMDGVVSVVRNYAAILNERYCNCYVVAPKTPGYENSESFKLLTFKSVKIPKRKPYRAGMPTLDLKYRTHVKDLSFDLVHAHSPFGSGLEAMRCARYYRIPLVATFHSKYYDDFKQALNSERLAKIALKYVTWFFNKVDYVWTVSESTAEVLYSYGYEGKQVTVIDNGVDALKPPNADQLAQEAVERFNYRGAFRMLFVGQLIWQKNIRMIVEALTLLKKSHPHFKMAFVGKGYAEDELKALCHERGLDEYVMFTGPVYDRPLLYGLYLAADLFVFPSVYDNSPLVVREAAAMETPSLLVKGSTAAQNVVDGENGFLCEESAESLCDRMRRVMDDVSVLPRVAKGAFNTLPKTWDEIVAQVYDHYLGILDEFHFSNKPQSKP
jgi:1,2-diacylglycerol 3-alpha-glucosyltransferase